MRNPEKGAVLLEAMVALALLAGVGMALVGSLGAALRSEDHAGRRETALRSADRVLTAMTLLTRNDLDQRLGRHAVGEFVVEVQRPEPTLYRIALSEGAFPEAEVLVTVVYRPQPVSP